MSLLAQYLEQLLILPPPLVEAVEALFVPVVLKKGDYFVKEGAYARRIGFLESGVMRAYALHATGKTYNKQFFVGPTLIGAYSSLITQQPNCIAQQALTDCRAHAASYTELLKLYDQHPLLERLGRRMAEHYFVQKEQKELERAFMDAKERYLLLRQTFPTLEQQIPQYHIAAYLGITPTQLSRIRHQLTT